MGCACGKGGSASSYASRTAAARGVQYVYDFTPPGAPEGTEPTTFGTPLEAKREVRKYGGGVVRRRAQTNAA